MRVDNPLPRMKNNILKTALCASLLALATSGTASAKALDDALDCHTTGHKFVAPLLAAGDIQSEPMHVESNSVNAFRTSHALTAYGFGVYVVLGYQANDPIFRAGDGTPIGDWAYGVVVRGTKSAVEEAVRKAGSDATVKQAFPFLTAIVCSSD
ncbi:hypothetical protein BLA6993_07040 [Burkholderia lata]|uniref:Uncharacterized protein n=2 Tax=Burkholderia lata (strain ATCC 17760 / DSM 23089 / LMG 22485 / NCIMB 9086 / R18194 / 383) TaxID=482957 RepID=Q39HL8_BURL3|nr:hypothetical protein Bcep18194_A4452 [Burkholderia lata]VWC40763.1 hypothetical protein BLA6993_07040 [Burkholderia lata]